MALLKTKKFNGVDLLYWRVTGIHTRYGLSDKDSTVVITLGGYPSKDHRVENKQVAEEHVTLHTPRVRHTDEPETDAEKQLRFVPDLTREKAYNLLMQLPEWKDAMIENTNVGKGPIQDA